MDDDDFFFIDHNIRQLDREREQASIPGLLKPQFIKDIIQIVNRCESYSQTQ
jgi:hypothetical protein